MTLFKGWADTEYAIYEKTHGNHRFLQNNGNHVRIYCELTQFHIINGSGVRQITTIDSFPLEQTLFSRSALFFIILLSYQKNSFADLSIH